MCFFSFLISRKKFVILIFLISIFIIGFSYFIGYNSALSNEKFIIFEMDNKYYVVLTIYKDDFLYVPFNSKKNEYEYNISLNNIEDVGNFKYEKIGKIHKAN